MRKIRIWEPGIPYVKYTHGIELTVVYTNGTECPCKFALSAPVPDNVAERSIYVNNCLNAHGLPSMLPLEENMFVELYNMDRGHTSAPYTESLSAASVFEPCIADSGSAIITVASSAPELNKYLVHSLIKSTIRLAACVALVSGSLLVAGVMLAIAEVFGIIEELV